MTTVFHSPLILNPDRRLRAGCYLICYTPSEPDPDVLHYDGTLRVQRVNEKGANAPDDGEYILASGDLYAHFRDRPVTEPSAGQSNGIPIPIFPREEYRFYLCVKSVPRWSITAAGFHFILESHSYDRHHDPDRRWYSEGQFTAAMRWDLPPPGYPRDALYAAGPVLEPGGKFNGTLTMTWISEYFRRARLVIHQARGVNKDKVPKDWVEQFKKFNWELETQVIENEGQIMQNGQPADAPWTDAQLREMMEEVRKSQQPDQLWRYDLLIVPKIIGGERGVTFYHTEDPACGHVRELATVAARYTFPTKADVDGGLYNYGKSAGQFLESQEKLYLRTAMHELGHAMGLGHNSAEFGFMMTTDSLAHVTNQPPEKPSVEDFPGNAKQGYSTGDLQRLRHWPDFLVRPGTDADVSVLPALTVPVFPDPGEDEDELAPPKRELARDVCLHAAPLNDAVPLGAPVRLVYRLIGLKNTAQVPQKPGFKSGALTVQVTASDGSVRTVSPLENDDDGRALKRLLSPQPVPSAATLLRDDDGGPLFPKSGDYKVSLEVSWWNPAGETNRSAVQYIVKDPADGTDRSGVEYVVKAETRVTITPPEPEDPNTPPDLGSPTHAEAARSVLSTPELQEVLVRHSALFPAANSALEQAMKCEVLMPHFAYLDFRVQADRLHSQHADLEPAFQVLLNAYKSADKPEEMLRQVPILTLLELEKVEDFLPPVRKSALHGVTWPKKVEEMLTVIRRVHYPPEDFYTGNGLKKGAVPSSSVVAKTSAMTQRQGQSAAATAARRKRKRRKAMAGSAPYVKKPKPPGL